MEINDIKRLYSISGILGTNKSSIVCPLPDHIHNNYTPSFSIFHDRDGFERFKCHGNCGHGGDVIDLVGYMEIPGYDHDNNEHLQRAMALIQGKEFEVVVPQKGRSRKQLQLSPSAWKRYFPPGDAAIRYLESRGVSAQTMQKYKIGQKDHYVSFPAFENGELSNIKFRRIGNGRGLRYFEQKGSRKSLYLYDEVAYTSEPVYITKGHIPTLLLVQHGLQATNITSGENGHLEEWWPQLALSPTRIYIGDNDKNPEIREKMQAFAHERAAEVKAEVKFPPPEYKDLDKWLLSDPDAIKEVRSWTKD